MPRNPRVKTIRNYTSRGHCIAGGGATSTFKAITHVGLAKKGRNLADFSFIGEREPTQEEMEEVEFRIEQVRQSWSEAEREIRRAFDPSRDKGGWTPPIISSSAMHSVTGSSRHECAANADADAAEYHIDE